MHTQYSLNVMAIRLELFLKVSTHVSICLFTCKVNRVNLLQVMFPLSYLRFLYILFADHEIYSIYKTRLFPVAIGYIQ